MLGEVFYIKVVMREGGTPSLPPLTNEEFVAWKLRRKLEREEKIASGDFIPKNV